MNRGITFQAIKNRKFTLFAMVVTMLVGLYSYTMLPRQENPDMTVPVAQIFVVYPGASPAEMEDYVTSVIEDELREIEGFEHTESVTKSGLTSIMFLLDEGVDPKEPFEELDEVMADVRDELPAGISQIVVNKEIMETPGMIIAMTGNDYTYEELADYADVFKDDLGAIDGVTRFEVYGDIDKEVDIKVNHKLLAHYGLTINGVINMINMENVSMPTGGVESDTTKIEVVVDAVLQHISEIENIVLISLGDGRQVRLKDIAKVAYRNNPDDPRFSKDGDKTVFLAGFFEESLNIVTVGNAVEKKLDELKFVLPEGIEFSMMVFQPHDVDNSINEFMINLLQAILFVVLVVLIGMGWRNAVVVSTVIPMSISMTMITMYALGVKLEQMSISGLIITLGLLVDNAIVVSDAIQVHLDNGMEKIRAAILGTREVAFPVLTSTMTTIFAFSPLLLLNSTLGEFIFGIPFIVTTALIASYVCALVMTPVIAVMFFRKGKNSEKKIDSIIKRVFMKTLNWSLHHRLVTMLLTVMFVIICFMSVQGLEAIILPKADKVMLQIDLTSEFASDIRKTEDLTTQTLELLKEIPELTEYYVSVGSNLPRFYYSVLYRADSPDIAQIAYTFDISKSNRFKTKEELQVYVQSLLNQNLVGGTAEALLLGLTSGRDIDFLVYSDDLDRLDEVRYELTTLMLNTNGFINASDNFTSKEYQFYVEVDEVKARYLGFSKLDIQSEVTAALMGVHANAFKSRGDEIPIVVASNISTKEQLENLAIQSGKTGQRILLKDLADIQMVSNFPVINHYNGKRMLRMFANVADGYSIPEVEQVLRDYAGSAAVEDVEFDFEGATARMYETVADLGILSLLALFLILSVLILQFSSYRKPLIILVSVPLAMSSSLVGLYLTGQVLSFVAMLSLVALMGIVVNNAIVLIDNISGHRKDGYEKNEACLAGVNRRYRPIVLSTTTTVIGLVPLLISGGELFRPLAVALMSGLAVSTIFTMVVIPTAYSLIMRKDEGEPMAADIISEPIPVSALKQQDNWLSRVGIFCSLLPAPCSLFTFI